jgi:hypothetical protein
MPAVPAPERFPRLLREFDELYPEERGACLLRVTFGEFQTLDTVRIIGGTA